MRLAIIAFALLTACAPQQPMTPEQRALMLQYMQNRQRLAPLNPRDFQAAPTQPPATFGIRQTRCQRVGNVVNCNHY